MQPRSASPCSAVFNCAAVSPGPLRFHSGIGGGPFPSFSRMASNAAYSPAVGSSFSAAVITAPLVVGAPTLSRTYDTSEAPQRSTQHQPRRLGQVRSTVTFGWSLAAERWPVPWFRYVPPGGSWPGLSQLVRCPTDTARGRAAHKSPGATLRRQNFSTALRLFPFENSPRLAFGVPATFPRA